MSLYGHDEIRIETEDLLESGGIGLQDGLIGGTHLALVVIEVQILNLVGEDVLNRRAAVVLRGSGRRRRADGDGGIGVAFAAGPGGGEMIGGSGSRVDGAAAIRTHAADRIIDLDAGRAGD